MFVIGYPLLAIVNILDGALFIYMLMVIASAVITWVDADPLNPIVRFMRMTTEPAFQQIRRYVPSLGGIDVSPIIVIFLIVFVKDGILPILGRMAQSLV